MAGIDTAPFRQALEEERARIAHALENLHRENPGSLEDESQEMPLDNHSAEMATVTIDREIDSSLEEHEEHVLAEIDAALARIDAGSYGICVTCGAEIGEERLQARPSTAQCIDCRRRDERG